jgi:hypothetical protein
MKAADKGTSIIGCLRPRFDPFFGTSSVIFEPKPAQNDFQPSYLACFPASFSHKGEERTSFPARELFVWQLFRRTAHAIGY